MLQRFVGKLVDSLISTHHSHIADGLTGLTGPAKAGGANPERNVGFLQAQFFFQRATHHLQNLQDVIVLCQGIDVLVNTSTYMKIPFFCW